MADKVLSSMKPELSLEEMVSTLHQAHLSQQATLTDLNSTIASLQLQMDTVDIVLKEALSDQSLLSKESIWLSQEIKILESDVLSKLINELDSTVVMKNSELFRVVSLRSKLERLQSIYRSKEELINSYMKDLTHLNSKYIDDDDIQRQRDNLDKSRKLVSNLTEEIKSKETIMSMSSSELEFLEKEEKQLQEEAVKLRSDISQKSSFISKTYDDEVNMLNGKINQLQTAHSAHKNQLRELNRIISSQSGM